MQITNEMLRNAKHHFAFDGEELPAVTNSKLFEYVVASNGIFVRARREGLEVSIPCGWADIRELQPFTNYVQWGYPKISKELLGNIFDGSRWICAPKPTERLYYLHFNLSSSSWILVTPRQDAGANHVYPIRTGVGSATQDAIIELHSHHHSPANFSQKDDTDEASGFRIYAVIGNIFHQPEIRVRVGCFGYFMDIPASEIFDLPGDLVDCYDRENRR